MTQSRFNFKVLVGRSGVFVATLADAPKGLREHDGSVRERAKVGLLPDGSLAGLSEPQARELASRIRSARKRRGRTGRRA